MIDVFKSDGDKVILAIYPDSDLAVSVSGEVGLIIGDLAKFEALRTTLNNLCGGWDKEHIEKAAFKLPKLTVEQKSKIIELYDSGCAPKEIPLLLGINPCQVNGVVQSHRFPIRDKIAKKIESKRLALSDTDRIIQDGIASGKRYLDIAEQINREVGGHWLPDDVHRRAKEMMG